MTILVQSCRQCGTVQYPRRDVCRACLSSDLEKRPAPDSGELLVAAEVHRSLEPEFTDNLPLVIGKVRLDCGIDAVCMVERGLRAGDRIRLASDINPRGNPFWRAYSIPAE